ncbi:hypothetical protein ACF1BN_20050 [Streptomyces sp. NPDC014861]|uniref:hypothetical protein n=1 Tax=Streptomyces sp. NPDC014861 TaxID=3364923 RepID=UPI0037008140
MLRNPDGLAYAVMALLGVDVFLFLSSAVAEAWLPADPTTAAEAYVSAENSLVMVAALAARVYFIVTAGVLGILFVHRLTSMQHAEATGMLSAAK